MFKKIMAVIISVAMLLSMASLAVTADTNASYIISKKDTFLYNLPNGGLDFPHERSYYKAYDGEAFFVTFDEMNYEDSTGYNWYSCLLVSKERDASWYYTTPVEWMEGYGKTSSVNYDGEIWYYTSGAAMHVDKKDEPANVFHLNDVTGVSVYKTVEAAVIDLLDYHFKKETGNREATIVTEIEKTPVSGLNEIILTLNEKKVLVGGEEKYIDVAPVAKNSRTMVPVRFIAEYFGADVTWNDEEQCAVIEKDGNVIKVYLNKNIAHINEKECMLDSPAFALSNRTFVPLRFISEGLGADVQWNADTQTVTITK